MADKNKSFQMSMLYDFFGELLTDKQREYFDLYYNEDLSLSEIAENEGISRQGVRDVIVRAENILKDTEEKTGVIARWDEVREIAQSSLQKVDELTSLSHDPKITAIAGELRELLLKLKG
jgi:hypothetical protein